MGVSVFEGVAAPGGISSDTVSVDGLTGGVDAIFLPQPLSFLPLREDLRLDFGTGSATFTRSTIGTFVDKDDGLVKTAAIDAARFEQNGILIEGASTNLLLRSEEFDNAAWTKNTAIVSADSTVAPDGNSTADGIQASSVSSEEKRVSQATASIAISTIVNHTVFVKKAAQDFAVITIFDSASKGVRRFIDLTDGSISTNDDFNSPISPFVSTKVLTNGWVRITVGLTTGSTGVVTARVQPAAVDGTKAYATATGIDQIFIWGAQLEELPFASSYIKTVASTVTRTADNLSIDAANIPVPTVDYSISASVDVLGTNSVQQDWYTVEGESFRIGRAQNASVSTVFHGGNAGADIINGTVPVGVEILVVTFDGSGVEYFQDSISQGTISSFTAITGTKTGISIGKRQTQTHLFGHIKNFRIYAAALTANQVATL